MGQRCDIISQCQRVLCSLDLFIKSKADLLYTATCISFLFI